MPTRFKILVILGLSIFCAWTIFPIHEKISLGLDLRGGVDLIYEIDTEKLKSLTLEAEAEAVLATLEREKVTGVKSETQPDAILFTLADTDPENLKRAATVFQPSDTFKYAKISETAWRMTLDEKSIAGHVQSAGQKAVEIIRNRIDMLGVKEPVISPQGDMMNRIRVQLPGEADISKAQDIIGSTALLEFYLVKREAQTSLEQVADDEIVIAGDRAKDGDRIPYYVLVKKPLLTGRSLTSANTAFDGMGKIAVAFSFNAEGAEKFYNITRQHVNDQLAIVLDNRVKSAPRIQEPIPGGRGQITGNFSDEEANKLAIILRSGSLPAPIRMAGGSLIGPSLGQDSIARGVRSAVWGAGLVFLFMLLAYKRAGIIADLGLAFNILMLLACLALIGANLTLPGIAGIALTLGMAVDANVLIFERIKEEIRAGKTVRAAIESGFERAFITIWDSNLTTLATLATLYYYGTGPIKGFATTISIGIVISLFTAVWVCRAIFDVVIGERSLQKLSI